MHLHQRLTTRQGDEEHREPGTQPLHDPRINQIKEKNDGGLNLRSQGDSWHVRHYEVMVVGWNFGCVVIDFDFLKAVDEWLEPARRQFIMGDESPEEARSKALIDMGLAVFEALGLPAVADDAPISMDDATSRYFEGYAAGIHEGKTVLVGRRFGLAQDTEKFCAGYALISARYGRVSAFWCNDASDSYMVSVFQDGTRIRFLSKGPDLHDDEGARLPDEIEPDAHGHDLLMVLLEKAAGCSFGELTELTMERFSPC